MQGPTRPRLYMRLLWSRCLAADSTNQELTRIMVYVDDCVDLEICLWFLPTGTSSDWRIERWELGVAELSRNSLERGSAEKGRKWATAYLRSCCQCIQSHKRPSESRVAAKRASPCELLGMRDPFKPSKPLGILRIRHPLLQEAWKSRCGCQPRGA